MDMCMVCGTRDAVCMGCNCCVYCCNCEEQEEDLEEGGE